MFQSTRPRGARPQPLQSLQFDHRVSIHAPAWGATGQRARDNAHRIVSIHAPAWGATGRLPLLPLFGNVSIHAPAWGATGGVPSAPGRAAVSIHAPAWGATRQWHASHPRPSVSIHAPAWGATRGRRPPAVEMWGFNPRARVGRDFFSSWFFSMVSSFNPRARVGRDFFLFLVLLDGFEFQSTRPRGARPNMWLPMNPSTGVSIHAPAWGATVRRRVHEWRSHVSIHAPAWGATVACIPWCLEERVSIHAPAWGATLPSGTSRSRYSRFNPRARVGRDACLGAFSGLDRLFQSTRPRGARLDDLSVGQVERMFQSTRPRGARPPRDARPDGRARVSIHAPAWGATHCRCTGRSAGYVSIHAPAWGATPTNQATHSEVNRFNPRARVGRDSLIITH